MENKDLKVLVFGLDGEYYATDIIEVERILEYTQPTEMPDVPEYVDGVINYENHILPIINLKKKFKFSTFKEDAEKKEKVVVIKKDNKKFGIVVENVYEVADIQGKYFEEAPEITTKISKKYMKGLINLEDKIIILLNVSQILTEEDEEKIF